MTTIFYKQSIRISTRVWTKPLVSTNKAYKDEDIKWRGVRKAGRIICGKKPYAISKISSWHKRRGHSVVRQDWVQGGYKRIQLMVTIRGGE